MARISGVNIPTNKKIHIAEFSEISCWPDSSLKWIRCNFIATSSALSETSYTIISNDNVHNIKIERRGKTSQTFAKKSYGFNIYGENNKKKSTALLDLPSSKKWVLYGPYADKSLIRNALAYSIYTKMGNYAPRTQFIELVIHNNYQGI